MNHFENYTFAFWGILLILTTVLIQSIIAMVVKASQDGAIPGKIDNTLSHSSFIFRSHRTFMNSLESLPLILGSCITAILIGSNILWTNLLIWSYAISRIFHMILYYVISTEKNPSPRSYFFLIGLLSNIGILILIFITLM
jgi:uncharacterized MAPEG superfamily protein